MNVSEQHLKLHAQSLVVDCLSFPYIIEDKHFINVKRGRVDASVITVGISDGFHKTVKDMEKVFGLISEKEADMTISTKAGHIRQAKKKGRFALILGFQDIAPIEGDLSLMPVFYRLGVRVVQITYTGGNLAGDGCGERTDAGLRYFGLELVEELNRLGILIDLSHCGDATTLEAVKHSKAPVAFTHANCRALCNNKRNKTDEQIKALADKGGVMGITPHPALVRGEDGAGLNDFLDHADHIANLVGVEHVAIGLDYIEGLKEGANIPESARTWRKRRPDIFGTIDDFYNLSFAGGIEKIEKLPNFTQGLLKRGYRELEVEKILGGNFLRVFEEAAG